MAANTLRFLGDPASPVNCTCNILDKDYGRFQYVMYMLDRTIKMFRYSGLPDTIPDYMLEYMLQTYGSVAVLESNGELYAFRAEFGGPPDPYYRPTQAVVANPALGLSGMFRIVNDFPPFDRTAWNKYPPCVRFLNDTQFIGLMPLFSRYASQMVENDISIRSAQINLRQQTVIVASTGPEIQSAQQYITDLEAGKLSAIGTRPFMEGVSVTNAATGQANIISQLLELQQYLKASWFNEIGLNSNFNMKSQYVSEEELNSTADMMLPLVDNMLMCREQAIEAINKEFGTSISVEKDSAWEIKQIQSDMSVSPDEPGSVDQTESEEIAQNGNQEEGDNDASSD